MSLLIDRGKHGRYNIEIRVDLKISRFGSGNPRLTEVPMLKQPIRVAIALKSPSVAAAGYPVRGIVHDPEAQAYRDALMQEHAEIRARIEEALGHPIGVVWDLTLMTNLISAEVWPGDIETIRTVEGVRSVEKEQQRILHAADADVGLLPVLDKQM